MDPSQQQLSVRLDALVPAQSSEASLQSSLRKASVPWAFLPKRASECTNQRSMGRDITENEKFTHTVSRFSV